jgi:hypothetical protein
MCLICREKPYKRLLLFALSRRKVVTKATRPPERDLAKQTIQARPTQRIYGKAGCLMLEITCQESDVSVVPLKDDGTLIRVCDLLAGIAINIPLTAEAFAALLEPEAAAAYRQAPRPVP